MGHRIAVIEGDDAAPEAMRASVDVIDALGLEIDWCHPDLREGGLPDAARDMIDGADTTYFGATSGSATRALFYLRWGKQTYANVRPCRWLPGARSALANPEGVDFVIVRENLEDLYVGVEGPLDELPAGRFHSRTARVDITTLGKGRYAVKAITEAGSRRVIRHAFELARRRRSRLTVTSKYNMLAGSDGLFLEVGQALAAEYPDVEFDHYIVDDFACRMIAEPQRFDVVVMPNLYGDILSDGAAALAGGLGMAASGCYGDGYAYFESAHGTAPDIAGQHVINPTATLWSGVMMLDYLGEQEAAARLDRAIAGVYARGEVLTRDQGGRASTEAFCEAVVVQLETD